MRRMISRPARAALPLGLGIYSLLMPGGAERALALITALMLARGLSLGAGGALRAAAGSVVRASRLRGNLLTAVIMAAVGGIITIILCMLPIPVLGAIGIWTAAAGALVNLAQVFADRMYSSEDFRSAAVYDIIIAVLVLVGLLISETDPWLMAVLPGCGMLAGLLLLSGLKNGNSLQPGMKVLKFAPLALLRGWLFPALITAAAIALTDIETDIAAAFAGIAILEWCEPVFRRSDEESRACSVGLSVIALIWFIMGISGAYAELNMPEWHSRAKIFSHFFMCAVPAGCFGAMITGLSFSIRRIIMAVLMLAASPLCVLAGIPDIAALRRVAMAKKLRRKRR